MISENLLTIGFEIIFCREHVRKFTCSKTVTGDSDENKQFLEVPHSKRGRKGERL